MKENAEEQRDRYYEENRELIMERRTYYETRGWSNADFNQALAKERAKSQRLEQELEKAREEASKSANPQEPKLQVQIKEVPMPLTEEQKQEIIAPYQEKIALLEGVIQSFHNLLVKLGLKREDSYSHDVPTLPRMSPQTKATLQNTIKRAISNANSGMER